MEGYLTVQESSTWEQVLEKSRFIGIIYPVQVPENVETKLLEARQCYPAARHYVYAYRLFNGRLEKASDDGEPQGTGGRPILEVLRHRDVWNVLLVVVRYFGGILLGTGGLTRAYGGTARQLLEQTALTYLTTYMLFTLDVPYSWYETLKHRLQFRPWFIEQEEFRETVELRVSVPLDHEQDFTAWLKELSAGDIMWRSEGTVWRMTAFDKGQS